MLVNRPSHAHVQREMLITSSHRPLNFKTLPHHPRAQSLVDCLEREDSVSPKLSFYNDVELVAQAKYPAHTTIYILHREESYACARKGKATRTRLIIHEFNVKSFCGMIFASYASQCPAFTMCNNCSNASYNSSY